MEKPHSKKIVGPEDCRCTVIEALNCPKADACIPVLMLAERIRPPINGLQGRFSKIPQHLNSLSDTFQEEKESEEPANELHPKNSMNDLNGSEWLYYTRSVWVTSFPSRWGHKVRRKHGANKPPDLMRILIEFFTKPGDTVLDPFAGVGGTLIGASIATYPRKAVGVEINPEWAKVYEKAIEQIREKEAKGILKQKLIVGDALEVLQKMDAESIDFIATDPPYYLHMKITMSTGDYPEHSNRKTNYNMRSDKAKDLANLSSAEDFFDALEKIGEQCYRILKKKKYMALIIRDAYQEGKYIMTHARVAEVMKNAGFVLKGDIIWTQTGMKLRPYGYPYAFVPNIVHQHILIFRKE